MRRRTTSGSGPEEKHLRNSVNGWATNSAIAPGRKRLPSRVVPALASLAILSSSALSTEGRGSAKRNSRAKAANRPTPIISAIVMVLNLDVNNLSNNQDANDHHGQSHIDHAEPNRLGEQYLFIFAIQHTDESEHNEGRATQNQPVMRPCAV